MSNDGVHYQGHLVLCNRRTASTDIRIIHARQTTILSVADHGTLSLQIQTQHVATFTDNYELFRFDEHPHVLAIYQTIGTYLFKFEDAKGSVDFESYLNRRRLEERIRPEKPSISPTMLPDRVAIMHMIKRYLSDPHFQEYVDEVERVWDEMVSGEE